MIMGHDGQWWREITIYLAIYRVDYNIEACGCYGHSAFVPGRLGRGCLSLCFILIAGDDRHTHCIAICALGEAEQLNYLC